MIDETMKIQLRGVQGSEVRRGKIVDPMPELVMKPGSHALGLRGEVIPLGISRLRPPMEDGTPLLLAGKERRGCLDPLLNPEISAFGKLPYAQNEKTAAEQQSPEEDARASPA